MFHTKPPPKDEKIPILNKKIALIKDNGDGAGESFSESSSVSFRIRQRRGSMLASKVGEAVL